MKGDHWTKIRETLPNDIQQCILCEPDCKDDSSPSNQSEEENV